MSQPLWSVVFAAEAEDDFSLIEALLAASYQGFGETPEEAAQHAEARIERSLPQSNDWLRRSSAAKRMTT
jgi:hypothetical protein